MRRRKRPPKLVEGHRLRGLVAAAARRPVDLRALQSSIQTAYWQRGIDRELEEILRALLHDDAWRADAANLFVAALRAICLEDLGMGLEFGQRLIGTFPDPRAFRSLITYHNRAGNHRRALGLLELVDEDEWSDKMRGRLVRRLRVEESNPDSNLLHHIGYRSLRTDPVPTVLLYGDMNMNLIDGSSVWLASVAEALCGAGFHVHFLLRNDIERELLLEPLQGRSDIELFEPHMFDLEDLGRQRALHAINALDSVFAYRCLVLRGMHVCSAAATTKSLWGRVWAYLTDFYTVDPEAEGGVAITDEVRDAFADFSHVFEQFLVQTPQIADLMCDELGVSHAQITQLPPLLPDSIIDAGPAPRPRGKPLKIGYAGKVAPLWGVLDLIKCAEQLNRSERRVEIHVIGDKIHDSTDDYPTFFEDATAALRSDGLRWHQGLSRAETLELMKGMDLAWCYRDPTLEKHTLELSTKLLESIAIGVPLIVTHNDINEQLLGKDYPLFVERADDCGPVIERFIEDPGIVDFGSERSRDTVTEHAIGQIRSNLLAPSLASRPDVTENPRRILVAGHDLKFIGHFESYLRRRGHMVRRDSWDWGKPADPARTRYMAQWADYVFCEWGLANAVWYSNNLAPETRLVVRCHQQEVIKAARKFPPEFDMDNIDAVVFVAEHIRDQARTDFGWSDDKLSVIPNFVDVAVLERDKLPEAAYRIGIVGIIPSQHKRFDRALDVIKALRKRDRRYTLAVKGKLPRDLPWLAKSRDELAFFDRQMARIETDPDLEGGVVFEEFSPRMSSFYATVGCVISPSNFESFHYTIADGAASGALPVVWSWQGADTFYPKDWIVDSVDQAVERITAHLGENFESMRDVGPKAREHIRENFGLETILPKLASVLLGE